MSYDVSDFATDVIDASHEHPVVVDFWAPWCGPCQQLSPVLESLAAATNDWTLVKVNTDTHPAPAQQYGVRGIPAVKLFIDGEVTAEFTGARPKHAVQQWLQEHLPSPADDAFADAKAALDDGDEDAARQQLAALIESAPDHVEARLLLAQLVVFDDPARALTLIEPLDVAEPEARLRQDSIETIAQLLQTTSLAELPEGAPQRPYYEGIQALRDHYFDTALQRFIDVVRLDRDYADDGARKACVALFTLLGPEHEATQQYRRTFDMALY
ncbi:tetratricopeptide repeat protein [Salisaeta longa]|uniref:tetratricopeptide repeat protein n=1 Tax=Salisaeta longa TaxID=503170 RepID=UPI0003B64E57|nr:tetratricopeptide repeat protein [Salisaeta longa]